MKIKKLFALALCVATVFALTACGESSSETEKYVAVTEPTYAPFESTDEDGNIVGFDIDLINAIAEDQGFEVEIKEMSFDALVPTVESKQADMIIAGMNETEERAEHVTFSDPYYDSGNYLMVMADSKYDKEADLPKDAKVACQTGTVTSDYVQELVDAGKIGERVVLDQHTTCVLQLENGDVDAVAGDLPVLDEYVSKKPDSYKLIGKLSTDTGDGCLKMAVNKENTELLDKLNAGLANVMDNGKYEELCEKWGITPLEK